MHLDLMVGRMNLYCMNMDDCLKPPCYSEVVFLRVPLYVMKLLHKSTISILPLAIFSLFYTELILFFHVPVFLLSFHVCDARNQQRLSYGPVIFLLNPASRILPYGICLDLHLPICVAVFSSTVYWNSAPISQWLGTTGPARAPQHYVPLSDTTGHYYEMIPQLVPSCHLYCQTLTTSSLAFISPASSSDPPTSQ